MIVCGSVSTSAALLASLQMTFLLWQLLRGCGLQGSCMRMLCCQGYVIMFNTNVRGSQTTTDLGSDSYGASSEPQFR